jgi:predicted AlkP superfamily phosphohydrolase/phosphomutase
VMPPSPRASAPCVSSCPRPRRHPAAALPHAGRASSPAAAALLVLAAVLLNPQSAQAYVGPGAGFAVASSMGVVLGTSILALGLLLIWPFRRLYRAIRHRRQAKPLVKRFIVVGLDGQDPGLTDRFLEQGLLPNFAKLKEQGTYSRLLTTYPSISPVAWSSFATGTQPGKHNIFDFLDRDIHTYLPIISSTKIGEVEKFLKVGKWRFPLEKPEITLLRKSKPFWTILGEANIWSTVLRVPITFPPDKFYGAQLGAMSIPDLLGTQGTFLLFTTRPAEGEFKEGGLRVQLSPNGSPDTFETAIEGPGNSFLEDAPPMKIPMKIAVNRAAATATVSLLGETHELKQGELSDWVTLKFHAAPTVDVTGLVRMQVTETADHFSLYLTPISIDPEKPAMPISHPGYYSTYLSKKVGPYSTLGLAEDTWALNENVTDDATFLRQSYDIDTERQNMLFETMDNQRSGSIVCVFDGTDRIQHMFWRYMEDGHPAAHASTDNPPEEHRHAIRRLYEHNDRIVGKVMSKLKKGDVLMVCSDHGFTSFRRGVNLNRWLLDHGYLHLKEGCDGSSEWLQDIDWSRTKAYMLGLAGMFINMEGRESQGIVPQAEAQALKAEIIAGLKNLRDEEKDEIGVNDAFDKLDLYDGPYVRNAPDLIIGYNRGYRVSWDCATGMVNRPLFEDNTKAWSGDHCVDPRLVPGVLFSTEKIDTENPALIDLAPTALTLFGLPVPAHMEGKPLFRDYASRNGNGKGKS